jgi:hypothetical protein
MEDLTDAQPDQRSIESEQARYSDCVATGAYEIEDGVVLFDFNEPLAWVQSDTAVTLSEMN